jgi:hypothetical protein
MKAPAIVRHPAFLWASGGVILAALVLLILSSLSERWGDVVAWGAIAVVAIAVIEGRDRLPALLGFLIALTAAVNGAGYALTLWHEETSFDEIVHFFTTFAGMAAIGWALLDARSIGRLSRTNLFVTIVGIGFILGVLWEGFEALIGISGRPKDTLIDLLMDSGGAALAAGLICWLKGFDRRN